MASEIIQKLRDLYEKNRRFLDEQESKIAHPIVKGNYIYNACLRDNLASKLKKASDDLEFQTLKILDKLPQKGYKEKFLKAETSTNQKQPPFLYPVEFKDLISKQSVFASKLNTILEIIKDREKADEVAYLLEYNSISGKLTVNKILIHTCKTSSTLGEALDAALNSSDKTTKIKHSLASSISELKIPDDLRKIMLRTGKGTLKVKEKITYDDLEQNHLDKKKIDKDFQKLTQKS